MAVVHNPSLPYTFDLSKPIEVGTIFQVKGAMPEDGEKFGINFKTSDGDIAFHFNPRFNDDVVVLNTSRNNEWGEEERVPCCSLKRSEKFNLLFLAENEFFAVILNGRHHCHYSHRLPRNSVTQVEVVGDMEISEIREASAFSSAGPILSPSVPFTAFIPEGFTSNKILLVIGETSGEPFAVNIQCGHEPYKHVALHIKPYVNENRVVLNDFENGHWGHEQIHTLSNISAGRAFVIELVSHDSKFEVRINGTEIGDFEHRHVDGMPQHCIDAVHIEGNVKLHLVRL